MNFAALTDVTGPIFSILTGAAGASLMVPFVAAIIRRLNGSGLEAEARAKFLLEQTRELGEMRAKIARNEEEIDRIRTKAHRQNNYTQRTLTQCDSMRVALKEAGWSEARLANEFPRIHWEEL